MNQEIKLVEVEECYELYINDIYKKLFNNHFEAYKNLLDAEEYVQKLQ